MRARDWLRANRPDLNVGTRGPLKPEAALAWYESQGSAVPADVMDYLVAELDSSTAVE